MRQKKCKQCKTLFTPVRPLQYLCGEFQCTVDYANASKLRREASEQKKERKVRREAKINLKTRSEWLNEAQVEFNKYIRMRDANMPCISCGRFHTGQYHAGHYRTIGSSPGLRFEENNVHKQCSACNNYLSGNIINYRKNLIAKIGIEAVEQLEADQTAKHYTIDEIKEIKRIYQQKIKELDNEKI